MSRPVGHWLWVLLLVAGLAAASGCPRSAGWTQLTGDELVGWEEQLQTLGKDRSSNELPTETGYWIDQGYGWQGPYYPDLLVPFCKPEFRLACVNVRALPEVASTGAVELFPTGATSRKNPVGRILRLSFDSKSAVYTVTMDRRTKDGFYCLMYDPVPTVEELFIYVDPRDSFDPIEKYSNSFLDGTLRVIDESGQELYRREVFGPDMPPATLTLEEPLPKRFAVEFRMDGSVYLFSHWATIAHVHPKAQYFYLQRNPITGRYEEFFGDGVGQGTANLKKSTNFSVWMDWTLQSVDKDKQICVWVSPGLKIVAPGS